MLNCSINLKILLLCKTSTACFRVKLECLSFYLSTFFSSYILLCCRKNNMFLLGPCFIIQLLVTPVKCQEPWESRKQIILLQFLLNSPSDSAQVQADWLHSTGIWWNKAFQSQTESAASTAGEEQDMTLVNHW